MHLRGQLRSSKLFCNDIEQMIVNRETVYCITGLSISLLASQIWLFDQNFWLFRGVKNSIGFGSFGDNDLALLALWHGWSYHRSHSGPNRPTF